ncbi:MAG: MauE/DoxX family redox-associated membrane protein [Bryobacteraceae bacterium]|jgi:uncharacterized membrane protein YphA (DoxX/SURF4 family)
MTFLNNRTPAGLAASILRIVLGALFVYAAWMKLRDPWALFAISIDSYQVLPLWAVELVARALPWFELLLGVLLISGLWRSVSATAASLLLAVFFSLMIRAMVKGLQIDCGCFGPGERLSWMTLLRDGALLASSLFVTIMAVRSTRGVHAHSA